MLFAWNKIVIFIIFPPVFCFFFHLSPLSQHPNRLKLVFQMKMTIWTIKMYCNLQVDIFITWSFPRIDLDPQVFLGLRLGFYSLIYDRFPKHRCLGGFPKHRSWPQVFLGFRFGFNLIYVRFPKHRCFGGFPKHRSWPTSLFRI